MPIPLSKFWGKKKTLRYIHCAIYKSTMSSTWDKGYNACHTETGKIMLGLDREKVYRTIKLSSLACEVDRISIDVSKINYKLGRELNLLYKRMINQQNILADALIAKEHEIIVRKEDVCFKKLLS